MELQSHPDPASKQLANVYDDIYLLLCVQCWTPDEGLRNYPKHVEFYSENKLEKSVHLVGFIMRIYHAARSSECQMETGSVFILGQKRTRTLLHPRPSKVHTKIGYPVLFGTFNPLAMTDSCVSCISCSWHVPVPS